MLLHRSHYSSNVSASYLNTLICRALILHGGFNYQFEIFGRPGIEPGTSKTQSECSITRLPRWSIDKINRTYHVHKNIFIHATHTYTKSIKYKIHHNFTLISRAVCTRSNLILGLYIDNTASNDTEVINISFVIELWYILLII